ncbi:MAG TPA: VCBS repeat-containing protein [Thermoanaerobaculia bacterium]|nr:VCBS repeat-containing protein [Thermoanaerobaculia bacterium]
MKRIAFLLAGLAGAALSGPAPDRSSPFRTPQVIDLGGKRQPEALAAADFDGDGKLDLAVGSGGSDDLVILLGDGRGGFWTGGTFPAGPSPAEIAAADFNRDGKMDLAIANHGVPLVTVLLGDGKGGFRPAPGSPLTVRSKPHPHTIAASDVNGDGLLDLVIDSWGENRLTWLAGDGKGGFAAPGAPIEAGRKSYRNLRVADLDGDDRPDIVVPNLVERGVTILAGDGRGAFHGAERPPLPAGPAPFSVAVADVNGDGKPDILVENYSGQITDSSGDALTFLLGDGRGGFRLGPRITAGRAPGNVEAGDVDGDGIADAVMVNAGSRDLTVSYGGPGGLSQSRTATIPGAGRAWRVLVADFDGNGRCDAVTASAEDHTVTVFIAR